MKENNKKNDKIPIQKRKEMNTMVNLPILEIYEKLVGWLQSLVTKYFFLIIWAQLFKANDVVS